MKHHILQKVTVLAQASDNIKYVTEILNLQIIFPVILPSAYCKLMHVCQGLFNQTDIPKLTSHLI